MKCPKCGKEIANDSLFCEYCGEKVKVKKSKFLKKKIIIPLCIVLTFCAIYGIIIYVDTYRRHYIDNHKIGSWPSCRGGDGTFYILEEQSGVVQSLVRIEQNWPMPIGINYIASVQGRIFACQGEHSKLGAFAFLGNDGSISFVSNYSKGGSLTNDYLYTKETQDGKVMYSDENHIYGLQDDLVCGSKGANVEMLFPSALGQPVRIGEKWRYILIGGEYMFEDEFDDAYPFCYCMARVCKDGRWFYIDSQAHELSIKYYNENCQIIQGENFSYDYGLGKAVAKMKLSSNGNEFWVKVDYEGNYYIVDE